MDKTTKMLLAAAALLPGFVLLGCTGPAAGPDNITGIQLDSEEIVLIPGESAQVNALLEGEGDMTSVEIGWISSEPEVATVSDGLVTALSTGTAFVTATAGKHYATLIVEVNAVGSIVIHDNEITVSNGESRTIKFTITPLEGAGEVVWTSSSPDIASVEGGVVTALSEGQAIIRAECGKISAECPVYVVGKPDIGDYLYSDGTFSAEIFDRKQAVGIVFWTGDPTSSDALLKRDFPECTNGLAASLTEESGAWQKEYYIFESTVGGWAEQNYTGAENPLTGFDIDDPLNRILGYNNTKVIEAFNADPANLAWKVDAVKRLLFFKGDSRNKAPEKSSGWYLPSAKELSLMCAGEYEGNIWDHNNTELPVRDLLNKKLNMLGGTHLLSPDLYWSSSEYDEKNAFCVGFYNGKAPYNIKGAMNVRIRYVLAF